MANQSLDQTKRSLRRHGFLGTILFVMAVPLLYIAARQMDLEWTLALAGTFACFAVWILLRGLALQEDVDVARIERSTGMR